MNHIGLEATTASSGDIHALSLPVIAAVLALVLAIGIISSKLARIRSLAVRHLFLRVKVKIGSELQTAFVRTLDVDGAVLVTSFAPIQGSSLELDLSSLPAFPAAQAILPAKIRRVKALGGQPSNYLLHVRFDKQTAATFNTHLSTYLRGLHA